MKAIITGIKAVITMMFSLAALTACAQAKDLLIVHTNDTHSCIMPINPNFSDTAQADKGGYIRRAVLVDSLRSCNADMLLLDCGDFSQGSAYYNLYKGEVEVKLMNYMKYDAATIGNHEFDFGLDNMKRIFTMAEFPIVCSNYSFKGTVLDSIVKPYVVLERKGVRIGILGLGPKLEGLVPSANCQGVTFEEPIESANRVARILKEDEKCDIVICLSHLGWDIDGIDDTELVPACRNIDIVLGGHSHTYFESPKILTDADGKTVICNQMGKSGRYVGTLNVPMVPVK